MLSHYRFSFTRADIIVRLLNWIESKYQCRQQIMERWGKPAHLFVPPMPFIPTRDVCELLQITAEVTQDPLYPVRFVFDTSDDPFAFYRNWVLTSPSLGTAILKANRGLNSAFQSGGHLNIVLPIKDVARWRYEAIEPASHGQKYEYLMLTAMRIVILRHFSRHSYSEINAYMSSPRLGRPGELESMLSTTVNWQSEFNDVTFPGSWAARINPAPTSVIKPTLDEIDILIQMPTEHDQFRILAELIVYGLAVGDFSLTYMAKQLSTTERTLQRNLKRIGGTFSWLTNTIRNQVAFQLLSTHSDLDFVAKRLGFANRAQFSRNFQRLNGYSPSDYLREHRREHKAQSN